MKNLPVSTVFDVAIGDSLITKTWCKDHPGLFPVYSGMTTGLYENVDSYTYDGDYLTWSKDGLAGYIMEHDSERFSITNHRGLLALKPAFAGTVSLRYARYTLESRFRERRVGRLADGERNEYTTLNKTAVEHVCLPLPMLSDGVTPDIERQRKYASKVDKVEKLRAALNEKSGRLSSSVIDISALAESMHHVDKKISELFAVKRGSNVYTREYMQEHNGDNPVYTAKNNAPAGFIDTSDHEGTYLTVSLNGLAGRVMPLTGKFSCTSDRAVLEPLENSALDLTYIKAIAEPLLRIRRHGRLADGERNEYTKLGVGEIKTTVIPIPVTETGEYDIKAQKRLSDRYSRLIEMRRKVLLDLEALCSIDVKFSI